MTVFIPYDMTRRDYKSNGHFRCTAHTACLGDDPAILQQRFLSRAYKERYFEYQQGVSPWELALVLQIKDLVSKGGP